MSERSSLRSICGFTLVELLVCILILAILVVLIFPTASRAIKQAQTTKCVGNQKQVLAGILLYANDNDGQLPHYQLSGDSGSYWWTTILPYLNLRSNASVTRTFRCPAAEKDVSTTLGVNYAEVANKAPFSIKGGGYPGSMRLSQVKGSTVLLADIENPAGQLFFLSPNQFPLNTDADGDGIPDSRPGKPSKNWFSPRHSNCAVCGFANGSVKIVPLKDWANNEGNMWGP